MKVSFHSFRASKAGRIVPNWALYTARIGPMLHPEASPDELRLIAPRTIKAPFGDTLLSLL